MESTLLSFTTSKSVPTFKLKKGPAVLARELDIGGPQLFRRALYNGICKFLSEAVKFSGVLGINGDALDANKLAVYALTRTRSGLTFLNEHQHVDTREYRCYAVVPAKFEGFAGLKGYMSPAEFKARAARGGRSLESWH